MSVFHRSQLCIVYTFQVEERHCEILGSLLYTAKLITKQEGLDEGYRIVKLMMDQTGVSILLHFIIGTLINPILFNL